MFTTDLLKGKVALVTGGGTGICRGIAHAFAVHGCDVAIASRKAEHLEPTAAELRARGVRAVAHAADVRDPEAVNAMMAAVVGELLSPSSPQAASIAPVTSSAVSTPPRAAIRPVLIVVLP